MKAFIYTGGTVFPENITERPEEGDLCIAADSGYNNALLLGVKIHILLGDFDSIGSEYLNNIPNDVEKICVPAEKDFTDTQLAIKVALERGAKSIVIIGGLCGRLDHTLSNAAILEKLYGDGIRAVINDGKNRVRYIKSSSELIARSNFKYLSVIASDKKAKGVSIEGCKYPLAYATLSRDFAYAISNEISKNCALVSVKKGGIYIIESSDIK